MKFITRIMAVALLAIPLLSIANGTYYPGTVRVGTAGGQMIGAYNVRYNPAVSRGNIHVSVNPGVYLSVSGVDSSTGQGWGCFYTPTSGDAAQYAKWETLLLPVAAGGNGTNISATQVGSLCTGITVQSDSGFQD